ncbi:MAG TPA: PIG-L deacetylase family protein [Chloroflexia bacterium]|nr:PIG-L deacetylase family protein [Chloroflexia bacterium]
MMAKRRLGVHRVLKFLAHRALFPLVEGIYAAGFALAGRLLRPGVRLSTPTGSDRVLVIAPHPDDETLGCGGTIALHSKAGDHVCVVIVTDGGSSRAGGLGREEMRRRRHDESASAMSALAPVVLIRLGLPEGAWPPEDLYAHLSALIERLNPTFIYTTSCVDFHPEHLKVARVVAQALDALPEQAETLVRVYELQVPLTPALANVTVGISATERAKRHALAEYATQTASFGWVPRHARYLRKLYGMQSTIEVFWELHPWEYRLLMSSFPGVKPRFRSIRVRPFSDGLAWMVGLRVRTSLRRIATGKAHHA